VWLPGARDGIVDFKLEVSCAVTFWQNVNFNGLFSPEV
jgi:hypothetical protein